MGNWSCLYHWFEFNRLSNAVEAYNKLTNAYDEYEWGKREDVAIKFGNISESLIQVVTSQKWGLEIDFTRYIYQGNGFDAAICAGVDSSEYFQLIGNPTFFNLSWNYIFVVNKDVDLLRVTEYQDMKNMTVGTVFNRKSLNFNRNYLFSKPFLDEDDLENDWLLQQIFNLFSLLFKEENRHYWESNETIDIVFGRNTLKHGNVNFGVLSFFSDGGFTYETNGSYNILRNEKIYGRYKTPITDENVLEL